MGAMVGGGRGAGSDPRSPALAGGVARIRRDRARRGRRRNLPGRIAGERRVARRAAREAAAEGPGDPLRPIARTSGLRTPRRGRVSHRGGRRGGLGSRLGARSVGRAAPSRPGGAAAEPWEVRPWGPDRDGRGAPRGPTPRRGTRGVPGRSFGRTPRERSPLLRRRRGEPGEHPERSRGLGRRVRRGIAGRDGGGGQRRGRIRRGRDVARVPRRRFGQETRANRRRLLWSRRGASEGG
mmetsp:Transcript_4089/g.18360  ORF Transcript_4089/g.18360 Transcript_4089/m.18360 type:complete len:238 (+) Transcript_4089:261-974(+)